MLQQIVKMFRPSKCAVNIISTISSISSWHRREWSNMGSSSSRSSFEVPVLSGAAYLFYVSWSITLTWSVWSTNDTHFQISWRVGWLCRPLGKVLHHHRVRSSRMFKAEVEGNYNNVSPKGKNGYQPHRTREDSDQFLVIHRLFFEIDMRWWPITESCRCSKRTGLAIPSYL